MLGLLLICHPNSPAALAASGGRMGGQCSSSNSSSSSNGWSSFSSYSDPYYASTGPPSPSECDDFAHLLVGILVLIFLLSAFMPGSFLSYEKTSVLKLQVGLLGTARSLQRYLNRIAIG